MTPQERVRRLNGLLSMPDLLPPLELAKIKAERTVLLLQILSGEQRKLA